MRNFKAVASIAIAIAVTGCLQTGSDIEDFQPSITTSMAPKNPLNNMFNLAANVRRTRLSNMLPIVPSYNGNGNLLASWTPSPTGVKNNPTFVILHGGHGITPTDFEMASWLRNSMNANVLILDSYWSRGQSQNWATRTQFGVTMRVLDAIAAGKWLKDVHGTDPSNTYMIGGSQGGWTVLRAFTNDPFMIDNVKPLYKGGIALYPVCIADGSSWKPRLGPYYSPVSIFTGGLDDATPYTECSQDIFTSATEWTNYPEQTHGWDIANKGAGNEPEDGKCSYALNTFKRFAICRSNKTTEDMHKKIIRFIDKIR